MKEKYQILCNVNSILISVILILFLTELLGFTSLCLAQGDTWTTKADMLTARFGLSSSVVDGKIYAVGGALGNNQPALSTVEEYDPTTDTWIQKEDMPTGRFLLSTCVVNGIIYAIGGSPYSITGTTEAVSTVEAYDPATNTWTTRTAMPTKRWYLSTSEVGGKIYAIGGGKVDPFTAFSVVEEYDPATDTWTTKASMQTKRWGLATSVVNGKIYAIGGQNMGGHVSTAEEYDPSTDTWTKKTNMSAARTHFSASAVNGIIYAIGGSTAAGNSLSRVEKYNPAIDTWTTMTNMPTSRWGLSTSKVNDRIYAIGGAPGGFIGLSTVEEYDPTATAVENNINNSPTSFKLHQNYPNPFNPETSIRYSISKPAHVVLRIMNLLGQEVCTLVNEDKHVGFHEVTWDGKDNHGQRVVSGVYLYRLESRDFVQTRKMIFLQ